MNVAALAILALLSGVAGVAANFAASPGFSGRTAGLTCSACHTPASPTHDDAKAILVGLPEAWQAGQTYELAIGVEGGPPAMPSPQPQGGMDLSIDGGMFRILDPMLLHLPNPEEVTYRPAGTMMREWTVEWTAPTLATQPRPVGVWLAVLAANGNHVVATNTSDQGEIFDATAALHLEIPPDDASVEAWKAMPLRQPDAELNSTSGVVVRGRHTDANATSVAWRSDGSPWLSQPTTATWTLRLGGLAAGSHVIEIRSEGADRVSEPVLLAFDTTQAGDVVEHHSPLPVELLLVAVLIAVIAWRKP